MSTELIVTILVGMFGGAGIAGLINALVARKKAKTDIQKTVSDTKKTDAETAEILVKAAGAAVALVRKELEEQIQDVSAENTALRCEIVEWKTKYDDLVTVQARHEKEISVLQKLAEQFDEVLSGAHTLYDQVVELNGEPKYKPPERRKKREAE